jgi:hypothetical protein
MNILIYSSVIDMLKSKPSIIVEDNAINELRRIGG